DGVRALPALRKLVLYCRGLRRGPSCLVEADGGRKVLRARAGLGSGLELILPGGLWTNVPVTEPFAARSPYALHRTPGTPGPSGGDHPLPGGAAGGPGGAPPPPAPCDPA